MIKQWFWPRRTEFEKITIVCVPGWSFSAPMKIAEAGAGGDYEGANHGESDDAGWEARSGTIFCAQFAQGTGTWHTAVRVGYEDDVLASV
jgi:hypothetical protein